MEFLQSRPMLLLQIHHLKFNILSSRTLIAGPAGAVPGAHLHIFRPQISELANKRALPKMHYPSAFASSAVQPPTSQPQCLQQKAPFFAS